MINDLSLATPTFDPDVRRGGNGKHQQEQNEAKRLEIIGRDATHSEQNRAQKFALRSAEARPKHVANASTVGGCNSKYRRVHIRNPNGVPGTH